MAVVHKCGGKVRVLGVAEIKADGQVVRQANPDQCPACFTVCKAWTKTELDAQKAAYEAKGGIWGPIPKEPIL